MSILIIAAALILIGLAGLRVANQYERAVVFRLGRYQRTQGPGLYWIIPLIEWQSTVDLRINTAAVEEQETTTKDNVPIKVNAVVYFRVIDPQRAINEHSTRIEQTIAHGQPFRWIEEGSIKKLPDGSAGSVGWIKIGKPRPQTDPGMPPGTWMYDAVRARREDLARAVMPEAAMGENPTNVTTYSQLALLHSQAKKRLAAIVRTMNRANQ